MGFSDPYGGGGDNFSDPGGYGGSSTDLSSDVTSGSSSFGGGGGGGGGISISAPAPAFAALPDPAPPTTPVVAYAADNLSFIASPQDRLDFASGVTFGRDGIGRAELTLPEKVVDFFLGPIDLQRQVSVNKQGLPTVTGTTVSLNPAGLLGMAIPVPGASVLTGYLGEKAGIPNITLAKYGEVGNPAGTLMGGLSEGIGGMFDTVSDALGPGTVTAPPETQGGEGFTRFNPLNAPPILPQLALAPTAAPAPAPVAPQPTAPGAPAPVAPPPVGPVVVPPPVTPINLPERFYTRDPFRPFVRQPVQNSPFSAGIGSLVG